MSGSSSTASSGKSGSIASTTTCASYRVGNLCRPSRRNRQRRSHVAARNSRKLFVTTPSEREIVLTRTFDAPRALVFEAWSKSEHVRRWYGCSTHQFIVCDIEFRVGGRYRFTMRAPDGIEHTMAGVYREIVWPSRIVCTECYE